MLPHSYAAGPGALYSSRVTGALCQSLHWNQHTGWWRYQYSAGWQIDRVIFSCSLRVVVDCPDDKKWGCSSAPVCFCNNLQTIIPMERQQVRPSQDGHFMLRQNAVNLGWPRALKGCARDRTASALAQQEWDWTLICYNELKGRHTLVILVTGQKYAEPCS